MGTKLMTAEEARTEAKGYASLKELNYKIRTAARSGSFCLTVRMLSQAEVKMLKNLGYTVTETITNKGAGNAPPLYQIGW